MHTTQLTVAVDHKFAVDDVVQLSSPALSLFGGGYRRWRIIGIRMTAPEETDSDGWAVIYDVIADNREARQEWIATHRKVDPIDADWRDFFPRSQIDALGTLVAQKTPVDA